jgi:aspartate/methionine/tyrosine aminotransferase
MSIKNKVERLMYIPGIGVDKVGNKADALQDADILRLENLDTDIEPLARAIQVTKESIGKDDNNSYLPFLGQSEMRKAAAAHVARMSGIDYDWQKQCIISAGGLSGILNTLLATIEKGDEVIVTDPIYAGLINRIYIAGGVPKFVPLIPSTDGWTLDKNALRSVVTAKTKMMLMMSPSMPTGHVLTEADWGMIADICIEKNIWLLYDAAMARILFDNRKVMHPASIKGMKERTITVGSASKELRMIGWRVGWIVGPESIMNDIGLVSLSNVVCQVGIAMPGVADALINDDKGVMQATNIWQKRRDVLLNELHGLPVVSPHGGWSMLLDTISLGYAPETASKLLLEKAKIAATPMNGWGNVASNYIRFVFANEPEERLIGIGQKIKSALEL